MAKFFDNIGKTINDVSSSTLQKGRDMADTTKLNAQIKEEEKKITGFYTEIGKAYFELHSEEPEEGLAGYVDEVKACLARIAEAQDKINVLKGAVTCPNCGATVPSGSLFCSSCGTKIEVQTQSKEQESQPKFCSACGAPVEEGANFCTSCGAPVE